MSPVSAVFLCRQNSKSVSEKFNFCVFWTYISRSTGLRPQFEPFRPLSKKFRPLFQNFRPLFQDFRPLSKKFRPLSKWGKSNPTMSMFKAFIYIWCNPTEISVLKPRRRKKRKSQRSPLFRFLLWWVQNKHRFITNDRLLIIDNRNYIFIAV